MLDDMHALQEAVRAYRAAATAAGVPWPENGDRNGVLSVDALCRIFDVDHIAEQPIWLMSEGLPYERILPGGGFPLQWTDASELLDNLSASVGIPFHWRHQLPLFRFEHIVYTFVLAGDNEGEIWRYQIDPDDWNPLRAAPSLAALFTQWTKGFGAGLYVSSPYDSWLHVGDGERDPVDELLESATDLAPFAFPVFLSLYSHEEVIRARQRECGVDTDRVDEFEYHEELLDAIGAARASLRG